MKVLLTEATHQLGMNIARCLARRGCAVVGVDERPMPWGIRSRSLKRLHLLPARDDPDHLQRLLGLLDGEKPDVFLPVMVTEACVRNQEEISRRARALLPPAERFRIAADKLLTAEECRRLGIAAPRTMTADEAREALSESARGGEPARVVVKPRRDIGGARGVAIVADPPSLARAQEDVERLYGSAVIQEYIPGPPGNMRTVNVLFDDESTLVAYFATHKIRSWPNQGGGTALSVSIDDRGLLDMVLPFFRGWRGPAEVELKIDARTGTAAVIEVNPRFWSYVAFPARLGVDFPFLTCQIAAGLRPANGGPPRFRTGIKYVNPPAYLRAVAAEFRSSARKLDVVRTVLAELRGAKVAPALDLSDAIATAAKVVFELREPGGRNGSPAPR